MKALVIDNEQLKQLLYEFPCFDHIVSFQCVEEALSYVNQHTIDVVFVDTEVPGMDSILLASQFKRLRTSISIIFVSAYGDYAVKAFEVQALDYVIKPFTRERLEDTVNRLIPKEKPMKLLHCLGDLKLTDQQNRTEVLLEKWRTKKIKELFCFLLHHHSTIVNRDVLIELLWPDLDLKKAGINLHSAIYQLRKTLDSYRTGIHIHRIGDGYQLELRGLQTDADLFQRMAKSLPELNSHTFSNYHELVFFYKNHYFQQGYYWWAEGTRNRLQSIWMKHAFQLAEFYARHACYHEALEVCYHLQGIDPDEERTYMLLIDLHRNIGDIEAACRQQEQLRRLQEDM